MDFKSPNGSDYEANKTHNWQDWLWGKWSSTNMSDSDTMSLSRLIESKSPIIKADNLFPPLSPWEKS